MSEFADKPQRASIELSDGSRLEVAFTPAPGRAPVDTLRLCTLLKADLEHAPPSAPSADYRGIVGRSPMMLSLFRMIDKVAPTSATVLITGENGTGKELVARAIHDGSPRANKPFVAANCSAFNDNLLESELFGHRRGAFTGAVSDKRGLFEEADGGTFLLDEVGDMSPALQVKLLRVLQEGTFLPVGGTQTKRVDVRIIAATNKDLGALVRKGTFREDLYYRLHVVALRTPPLRERGEDLERLIEFFLGRLGERQGQVKALHPVTLQKLRAHRWPGNVRELQNEMERLWVLSGQDPVIGPEHLSKSIAQVGPIDAQPLDPSYPLGAATPASGSLDLAGEEPLNATLERVERQVIERALRKVQGNRTRAAVLLGVSRRNLIRKLHQLGLAAVDDAEASD